MCNKYFHLCGALIFLTVKVFKNENIQRLVVKMIYFPGHLTMTVINLGVINISQKAA